MISQIQQPRQITGASSEINSIRFISPQQHFFTQMDNIKCNTIRGVRRNTDVLWLRKYSAKGNGCVTARERNKNILNMEFIQTDTDLFRSLKYVLVLARSTKLASMLLFLQTEYSESSRLDYKYEEADNTNICTAPKAK